MDRRTLKNLAVIALCLAAFDTARSFVDSNSESEQELELDCPSRSAPGLHFADRVLHIALVQMAASVNLEAVLDAVSVPLSPGKEFESKLGFQTAGASNGFRSTLGLSHALPTAAPSSRPLPQGFNGVRLELELRGRYFGEHEGLHLLNLGNLEGNRYEFGPGFSGGGSENVPLHPIPMRAKTPIARVYPSSGLAVFAVLTESAPNGRRFEPGRLAEWRNAFAELESRDPIPDRRSIDAAVDRLGTDDEDFELRSADFLTFGPLLDGLTAAFVLRDPATTDDALRRAAADPTLLDDIRAAGIPQSEHPYSKWFVEQNGTRWLDFLSGWAGGAPVVAEIFDRLPSLALRVLALTKDAGVARAVERSSIDLSRNHRFALDMEPMGRTAEIRTIHAELRASALAGLSAPWNIAMRSPSWLIGYALLVPILALIVSFVPSGKKPLTFEITPGPVFVFALLAFVSIDRYSGLILFAPMMWYLCVRWLRQPLRHGFFERALIWLALSLVTIQALQSADWYFKTPPLDAAISWGVFFCWIIIGLWITADGRWRAPHRFRWFLGTLLAMHGVAVLLASMSSGAARDQSSPLLVALMILGLLFLLGAIAGGRNDDVAPRTIS